MSEISAVILAGGEGTRLRPYTQIIPKPLVPIIGTPVIEIVLRQLARFEFRQVAVTLGYEADIIKANFGDGKQLGLNISYNIEENPLGTAGPLAQLDNLADRFLVMNGDLLTTLDFRQLFADHAKSDAILTIAAHERFVPVEYGVIKGENLEVNGYVEKPKLHYLVSMGVYAFNHQVLEYINKGERFDFPDLVHRLLKADEKIRYYPFDGYWLDIGSCAEFDRAVKEFPKMKEQLLGES